MKSKRAKSKIEETKSKARDFAARSGVVPLFDAVLAVELAEQDAEERAVRAFCGTCSHSTYPTCDLDICIERKRFKELLNNGGQRDE